MFKSEMRPMVYDGRKSECLYFERRDDGFEIAIINVRGDHPCGYINVPKQFLEKYDSPKLDYDMWGAEVHGGFTYADTILNLFDFDCSHKDGFWLGWDYAHLGDYCYCNGVFRCRLDEKQWQTEDILKDANRVIETLTYYD